LCAASIYEWIDPIATNERRISRVLDTGRRDSPTMVRFLGYIALFYITARKQANGIPPTVKAMELARLDVFTLLGNLPASLAHEMTSDWCNGDQCQCPPTVTHLRQLENERIE